MLSKKRWKKKRYKLFWSSNLNIKKYKNAKADFSRFIKSLTGKGKKQYNKEDKYDRKPIFTVTLDFFSNEMNNYYEIEQIDKIKEIINQSKSDVETVCKNLGLKDEKINTVKLILAREY